MSLHYSTTLARVMLMIKFLPKVFIVGRPNVGKSTLVNRVLGQNRAITFDEAGVTRDVSTFLCTWKDKQFELMDSGGVYFAKQKQEIKFQDEIESRVKQALEYVDKIVFVVDCKEGINPIDRNIAALLRSRQDDVFLVVNKVDDPSKENMANDFHRLGFKRVFFVSSLNNRGFQPFLTGLTQGFPKIKENQPNSHRISFVGRPNVGKSSLMNAIFQQDRVIVSDEAGTTRDAVEAYFMYHEQRYVFVDTAGIRKQARIDDGVEYYSVLRSQLSVDYSDCVVMLLDADKGLSQQDKKIIGLILEKKKNMIIFVNKWDLTEKTDKFRKEFEQLIVRDMPQLSFYPILFGSAKDRHHIGQLLDKIPEVIQSGNRRVQTSELNQFVDQVLKRNPPTAQYGQRVKVLYGTQADVSPPTFIFFVNHAKKVSLEYYRFVEKRIRLYLGGFTGNSIVIRFKSRNPEKTTAKK